MDRYDDIIEDLGVKELATIQAIRDKERADLSKADEEIAKVLKDLAARAHTFISIREFRRVRDRECRLCVRAKDRISDTANKDIRRLRRETFTTQKAYRRQQFFVENNPK